MNSWLFNRHITQKTRRVALAMVLLATCMVVNPVWAAEEAAKNQLGQLMADYDQYLLAQNPILAAQFGNREAARKWPDDSAEANNTRSKALSQFKQRIDLVEEADLSVVEATNRAFLARSLSDALALDRFDQSRLPFSADSGFFQTPDFVGRTTVIRDLADAQAWIARLRGPAHLLRHSGRQCPPRHCRQITPSLRLWLPPH